MSDSIILLYNDGFVVCIHYYMQIITPLMPPTFPFENYIITTSVVQKTITFNHIAASIITGKLSLF